MPIDEKQLSSDALLAHVESGACVISATNRLARELHQKFAERQSTREQQAWHTPQIVPFSSWLFMLWENIRCATSSNKKSIPQNGWAVLNSQQSYHLWQQCIKEDIKRTSLETEPLWNIESAAKTAMDAWQIIHQWSIPISRLTDSSAQDHQSFLRWIKGYQAKCQNNRWLDLEELPELCIGQLEHLHNKPQEFIFVGFDHFTPTQEKLLKALKKHSNSFICHPLIEKDKPKPISLKFNNEQQQWLAVAKWAKSELQQNASAKLALVVPDLQTYRAELERILIEQLCPDYLHQKERLLPFHISLGNTLQDNPLVSSALELLKLCNGKEISQLTFSNFITHPLIKGAQAEENLRSQLEHHLKQVLPYQTNFSQFLRVCLNSVLMQRLPILHGLLSSMSAFLNKLPIKSSYRDWSSVFLDWLDLLGWPGQQPLSSDQFQLVETFRKAIRSTVALDLISRPVGQETAWKKFHQTIGEQYFEAETHQVNIEVMGVLESTGLKFDALWFGALIDNNWPASIKRNPFLPSAVLHEVQYPNADTVTKSAHTQAIHQRLLKQAQKITLSYHLFEEENEQLPSPLVSWQESKQGDQETPSLLEHLNQPRAQFENISDNFGLNLTDNRARGGSTLLKDQAECAFRAYAKHRLGAKQTKESTPGLDAMDKGALIHQILDSIWTEIKTASKLRQLPKPDLQTLIQDHVKKYHVYYQFRSGLKMDYHQALTDWLTKLVFEWLEVEKSRVVDFEVWQTEQTYVFSVADLELSLKVDRVDRNSSGDFTLIDYKSGRPELIKNWFGARPKQPQLPLYALATNQSLQGKLATLAFGHIRTDGHIFNGIGAKNGFLNQDEADKIKSIDNLKLEHAVQDWLSLLDIWQNTFNTLAKQFQTGTATVNPLNNQVCTYCDLHAFCRIGDRK